MMRISRFIQDKNATLKLSGNFVFDTYRDFTDQYASLLNESKVSSITIDLSEVEYLDSSALGMLLILKERAAEKHVSVTLKRPCGNVKQILEVASFGKLFHIA